MELDALTDFSARSLLADRHSDEHVARMTSHQLPDLRITGTPDDQRGEALPVVSVDATVCRVAPSPSRSAVRLGGIALALG